MVNMWKSGEGPVITTIKSVWSSFNLPNPPKELVEWIPGKSPLSLQKEVIIALTTYLVVIFSGRELMR